MLLPLHAPRSPCVSAMGTLFPSGSATSWTGSPSPRLMSHAEPPLTGSLEYWPTAQSRSKGGAHEILRTVAGTDESQKVTCFHQGIRANPSPASHTPLPSPGSPPPNALMLTDFSSPTGAAVLARPFSSNLLPGSRRSYLSPPGPGERSDSSARRRADKSCCSLVCARRALGSGRLSSALNKSLISRIIVPR